ncbi:3-methyl-2-oxobutanoate hydroxymethyltransferase [Anaerohalosphaera lusitana]|uniref:3-methyl-2-oxobutanoate hydroxymethyltransferase n=1 Tax=Anaerohalosphaera lusitana TaxID=1936003 RepID=A0A1U9NPW4_9BACT|nr:3-methyl-2-oxobutanoate hydroxymethyltransferase [Anaerohalosphaera lusitana]AQT69758.1 3-methyl-2-oxobutanoate hydroxymethyltransferase [Anaerohalosphaera lusitana]
MPDKITIADLLGMRNAGRKITSVSCYDYTTAKLAAEAGVDMILVGDSAAQVILGHDSTLPVTMDFMVQITAAVKRAAPNLCIMADMPFLSYHTSIADAVRNAGRFIVESGAATVKIEATAAQLDVVKAVSDAGIPVTAHIGIRPQSVVKLGKLKAQGTTADMAFDLITLSDKMVKAGASMLLIEGTAREVAKIITERSPVPVISCGAGPDCDGQILIISDILGLSSGPMPKFAKSYADLATPTRDALRRYADEIRESKFPDDGLCYHVKPGEMEKLGQMMRTLG